jgi:hypothetical protein
MIQLENEIKRTKRNDLIQPDTTELLEGGITLTFSPGSHYTKIANLKRLLSDDPNIKTTSTGGFPDKGSWIRISIQKPTPLFQILYHNPNVLTVSRKGKEIHILIY